MQYAHFYAATASTLKKNFLTTARSIAETACNIAYFAIRHGISYLCHLDATQCEKKLLTHEAVLDGNTHFKVNSLHRSIGSKTDLF
jgi:hypothetical protein